MTSVLVKTCLFGALVLAPLRTDAARAESNPCDATGMKPHDYSQALCMSYVFYEAQRSGALPEDQRVTWRADSALDDGSDVDHDLTGGYYDAGDLVKFGFPLANVVVLLAWGLIDFAEGHDIAGQTEYGRMAVKWATDYILKCHTAKDELYGQVGNGHIDHAFWGRPEDMTMDRPSYKIDEQNPGTELAAETAAALAAASIVFKEVEPDYASEMLEVAKELYDFSDNFRETYDVSIPDATEFYHSYNGYGDELCWGALWLARATGDDTYLTRARQHWDEFNIGSGVEYQSFSWDNKTPGIFELFWMLDGSEEYLDALNMYLDWNKNNAPYTPEGMIALSDWGSCSAAASMSFLSLLAAKNGINVDVNREWSRGQIGQILGDNSRYNMSFVVGFGDKYPERPHHRASSCPDLSEVCDGDWAFNQTGPNPHVIYGALVGGPAPNGDYEDVRNDYVHNEVAIGYNAVYTAALAALVEIS